MGNVIEVTYVITTVVGLHQTTGLCRFRISSHPRIIVFVLITSLRLLNNFGSDLALVLSNSNCSLGISRASIYYLSSKTYSSFVGVNYSGIVIVNADYCMILYVLPQLHLV